MAPDERRRRLASGADLHASEEYDVAQPCSDLNITIACLYQILHIWTCPLWKYYLTYNINEFQAVPQNLLNIGQPTI